MNYFKLLCAGLSLVSASIPGLMDPGISITLQAQYGNNFFASIPAYFFDAEDQIHIGTIRLDFSNDVYPRGPMIVNENVDIVYPLVVIGEGGLRLDLNHPYNRFYDNPVHPLMFLQLGPMSPLMNRNAGSRGRGFIISPLSENRAEFVINPENPREYAFGGEIFYAPRNPENSPFWTPPFSVRLIRNDQDSTVAPDESDFIFCTLFDVTLRDTTLPTDPRFFEVPSRITREILALLSERGVRRASQNSPILSGFDESFYDTLPSIQYILETVDGQNINLIVLEPRQYITQFTPGNYYLHLQSTNRWNEECRLNGPILQKLVIHFDIENGRIGFGEPLVEL